MGEEPLLVVGESRTGGGRAMGVRGGAPVATREIRSVIETSTDTIVRRVETNFSRF